ncbi:hypothetical protein E9549_11030 [Blastococcus sp. MG754426]|uniref:hypothetical protein n=1 Tax=unclassified Blastococcus TaxID=2619396 RepID=UPI001EEFB2F8|nr:MULTISPECIES: hypothetical protein [unclassified Blastococcus]MCF6507932.1 hypothetical protein [Blastococcus sp. MG754426]MCF6512514.1 hypothetical protein [Blastococcus sp. MG754427]MCF6736613.1 hypothetical protein [Blastococcus sp. KM273129]
MRLSRVLLAGVAVAGVAATSSAFTAGNTNNATSDDVVGYMDYTATGVTVSNIAYTPLGTDASKLDMIVFTITEDATDMNALLTLRAGATQITGSPFTCGYEAVATTTHTIKCDVSNTIDIETITEVGLTVTSK